MAALAFHIIFLNIPYIYIVLVVALFLEFVGILSRAFDIPLYPAIVYRISSALSIHGMYHPASNLGAQYQGPIRRTLGINGWGVIGAGYAGVLLHAVYH